jgi:hypothetical protein
MPWFKDVCTDVICGGSLGVVKGVFGLSLFTESETEEIMSLKKLALSVIKKVPEIVTEPVVCEGIRNGQKSALESFTNGLSPEAIAAGVGTAAELVCTKSFKERFTTVLTSACMNLVGC